MQRFRRGLTASLLAAALTLSACGGTDDGATVRNLDGEGNASGSASGSGSGSASASAPVAAGPSGGLGGYEPASDVDAHARLVLDVCDINAALPGDGNPDFEEAANVYREGGNSPSGDGFRTLQGAATGERDEPIWNRYADYFGSPTFADDFVTAALEGTGAFAGEDDAVRRQGVQKGVQNQVLMAYVFHELDAAAAKVEAGETDAAEGAPHNVDEIWAFYHGADPACGPYGTAAKRGEDFGRGQAVNDELLDTTEALRDAALDGDADAFAEHYDHFVATALVPYVQATIKYAQVMGEDLAGGDATAARTHQAEGYAFWRVLAPFVAEADAAAADRVETVLSLDAEPSDGAGDTVRTALEDVYDDLGISAEDVGELAG